MRWTMIVLAASLAVGVAPVTAGPRADAATRKQQAVEAWTEGRARIERRLPVVPLEERLEVWGDYAELVDAGDLDGDGKTDVMDLRTRVEWDDAAGIIETLRLDAYRGSDGKLLWTRTMPPSAYTFPYVTKVGVDGKPGVIVLLYGGAGADSPVAGAGAGDVTVLSFDRTGAPVWARPLAGGGFGSIAAYSEGYSDVAGFFDAAAGGGTDLLIQTATAAEGGDPTGNVYEAEAATQFSVLDGATGTVRPFGEPVRSEWGVYGMPTGDLDGDKLDDVVVEIDGEDGIAYRAVGSTTGKTLWTKRAGNDFVERTLPDVNGDGIADLGLRAYSFSMTPAKPAVQSSFVGVQPTSGVLDGKTGKVLWRKPGSYLAPLGNVDGKRGTEVVVGTSLGGKSVGFTVAAYNAAGKRLWSTTRKLAAPTKPGKDMFSLNSWGTIGDVHTDGIEEIGYAIKVGDGKKERRDEGMVNGRNGRVTRDPKPDMWATRARLDGRGSDAYLAATRSGVFTLETFRGDTGGRLWTTAVRAPGVRTRTTPVPGVDGDKCDELAVTLLSDETYTTVVYSGSTGKALWVLTRTGNAEAKVAAPSVARNTVYRRGC